jgi:hypothetical protein
VLQKRDARIAGDYVSYVQAWQARGLVYIRTPAASGRGNAKAAPKRVGPPGAAEDRIEAGVLHLPSLQRRGLILREDRYNVVTRAPTVGTDSVVPDSKREKGVHARYALLGTRSTGGGRRPSDRLGTVPIGPPLALAARCGPGLTH